MPPRRVVVCLVCSESPSPLHHPHSKLLSVTTMSAALFQRIRESFRQPSEPDSNVFPVPAALIGAAAVNASLYDVPGGFRAVMFDRFSGVKSEVRWPCVVNIAPWCLQSVQRLPAKAPTSSFLGSKGPSSTTAASSLECVSSLQ